MHWIPFGYRGGALTAVIYRSVEKKKKSISSIDFFAVPGSRSRINLPNNSRSILHLHATSINTLHIVQLYAGQKKNGGLTYSSKSITRECLFILDLRNSVLQ